MASRRDQLRKRIEALVADEAVRARPFDLAQVCFPRQLPFALESARFSTAVCTRRSGKTTGIAAKLLSVAKQKPGCVALYITKSRINAKRIFWRIVKQMAADYALLASEPSEAELRISLPNGSEIYLAGCVDETEIENFRGLPIGIVVLDEAQSLPAFIERLVDEVLAPALMDYNGQLVLVGTPGPVPVGYFYSQATSPKWAHHSWSVFDNPYIEQKSGRTPEALLEEELARRGVTAEEPSIQREWFGRWVLDTNALVFRYSEALNHIDVPPKCQHHVLAIDLGYVDADALAVLGWNDDSPNLYLVREKVTNKQHITPLAAQVRALYDEFQPLAVVCDFGGLGTKIAMELQDRTGLPIEAAEKPRKLEHIELLNDGLRTGTFKAHRTSRFAQDCLKVEWDRKNPEKPKISARFHSDVCDAVLYGWRRCQQWLYKEPPKLPKKLGEEGYAEEVLKRAQEQEEAQMAAEFEANQREKDEREDSAWL